jgi:CRISPR-associated endonuclease/helicase Cas3
MRDRLPELKQTGWGFVYDAYVLYRTWSIAGSESVWQLPEDIDRLVQAVYSHEPFAEEDRAEFLRSLDDALGKHLAALQEHRQRAINVAVDAEAEPHSAYTSKPRGAEEGEGLGLRAVTRLGDDSITVVPVLEGDDGWRLLVEDDPFDPQVIPDDALARRIYQRQVRLGRKGIMLALVGQPGPVGFEGHPLLKDLKALRLRNGVACFEQLKVRLDPELGITYETPKNEREGA